MARDVSRRDGLKDRTALDLPGIVSRTKCHRQYRRNEIPATKMRANKYAAMDQDPLGPSDSMMG